MMEFWNSSATMHNLPFGLSTFAKPDMASQNQREKLCRDIQLSNHSTQLLEAISGFAKPLRQIVDCCTTLRSQTWLRKIDARSCVEIFSYQTTRCNFLRRFQGKFGIVDATSCVNFAKPFLASLSLNQFKLLKNILTKNFFRPKMIADTQNGLKSRNKHILVNRPIFGGGGRGPVGGMVEKCVNIWDDIFSL